MPCLMLGGSAAGTHIRVAGFDCEVVAPEPFSLQQWALVSHPQQAMLRELRPGDPMPCGFTDLSNNNSVNIFWNHLRMWERVRHSESPVLILEDDAVAFEHSHASIKAALVTTTDHSPPGFVIKLHNHDPVHTEFWTPLTQWSPTEKPLCLCDYSYPHSSTLAYIIDAHAARLLLRNVTIDTHVDLHIHNQACNHQLIQLYSTRKLFSNSERPSLHRSEQLTSLTLEGFTWFACNKASLYRAWLAHHNRIRLENKSFCPTSTLL